MTHDEIISIYREVSNKICNGTEWCWVGAGEPLQLFAHLVAAKEREDCAKVCETHGVYPELNVWNGGPDWYKHGKDCAAAIRARGEQA